MLPRLLHRLGLFQRVPTVTYQMHHNSRTVAQVSVCNQNLSDHIMFHDSHLKALSWNIMMQGKISERNGKIRPNTAFALIEDAPAYNERLREIVKTIARTLQTDLDIDYIALQEGPINEHLEYFKSLINEYFPPDWNLKQKHIELDCSSWGLITILNRSKLQCDQVTPKNLTQDSQIKDFDARCRTFCLQRPGKQLQFLTTLHLPHDNPETSFKYFFAKVISSMMDTLQGPELTHTLVGDWNLNPQQIQELMNEVLEFFRARQNKDSSYAFTVTVSSSQRGHLKFSGQRLTVDHAVTISVRPSEEYIYCISKDTIKDMMSLLAAGTLIGGSGMMYADKLSEEESIPGPNNF